MLVNEWMNEWILKEAKHIKQIFNSKCQMIILGCPKETWKINKCRESGWEERSKEWTWLNGQMLKFYRSQ